MVLEQQERRSSEFWRESQQPQHLQKQQQQRPPEEDVGLLDLPGMLNNEGITLPRESQAAAAPAAAGGVGTGADGNGDGSLFQKSSSKRDLGSSGKPSSFRSSSWLKRVSTSSADSTDKEEGKGMVVNLTASPIALAVELYLGYLMLVPHRSL